MTKGPAGRSLAGLFSCESSTVPHDFQDDLDAIAAIPAIPTILEVVCRTTGLRFAAVARVTDNRWICLASKDDIEFGLASGDELEVGTTICNEIREHHQAVAIDHVAESPDFCLHPTPLQYGFQSYISVPIVMTDGRFFGTLCAIDPHPNSLNNPSVIGMFNLFATLIAHELDNNARIRAMRIENETLKQAFRAGLGHDMRNTLMAMTAGTRLLAKTPLDDRARMIVAEMENATEKLSRQIGDAMSAN
jgi:GAF domain-containing protein